MNSLYKRDFSVPGGKGFDFQVRVNGPYYSYRDPINGKREFVFDEEIQDLVDEGLTPIKAIERFLVSRYTKAAKQSRPKLPNIPRAPRQTGVGINNKVAPWLKSNNQRTAKEKKNQVGKTGSVKKLGKVHRKPVGSESNRGDELVNRTSPASSRISNMPRSVIDFDEDGYRSSDEEGSEAQMPLVPVPGKRRWQLKFDVNDDFDSYAGREHSAMSIMCMKDEVQAYLTACKQFEVTPSQTFIDQIGARTIRIKYQSLTPIELGPILHVLAERSTTPIIALDLSCNQLTDKAAGLLVAFLNTSAADCLTYLNLSDCNLGFRGGEQLLDCLQDNFSIKEMHLSANHFGDAIGPALQNLLAVNDVLTHLDISRNGISTEAAEMLAYGLSKNTSLVSLNASWNGIRLRGAEAMGNTLALTSLTEINLSWNGISNDGCRTISSSLSDRGCSLKALNLECNRIGMLGAYALARGLRHNRSLKKLDLTLNPITTEGVKAVLKALINNYNTGIEMLELRDIPVEQSVTGLIDQIRRRKARRNRSEFSVNYGQIIHDPDFYISTNESFTRVNDPITILFRYIKEKGLRLLDLFAQFDKDRSSTVSFEEFRNGFLGARIPLTEAQLDYLFGVMDIDGNGEIDFGELLTVQQQYRENMRKKLTRARQEEIIQHNGGDSIKLPKITPVQPHENDLKKNREKILKARDAYIKQSHVPDMMMATATGPKSRVKLPEISDNRRHPSITRKSSFKEALDAERYKIYNALKPIGANQRSRPRFSQPPTIELEESSDQELSYKPG